MKETGLSRTSKNLIIRDIEKKLADKPTFVVAQYGRVPASGIDKLRAKLRKADASFMVVKKSLGSIVLKKAGQKELTEKLEGNCGIAFSGNDPVIFSKILMEFQKENETFKVQAGLVNGQVLGADQIKVLASLPPREELIARAVGCIRAPLSRLMNVLVGTNRKFVTVLDAIAKKKGNA